MSYSACSNSAIYKPDAYPRGAIGSVIIPTLNTGVAKASLAAEEAFTPITLPEGVWSLTGCLQTTATGGNTLVYTTAQCRLDGATNQGRLDVFGATQALGFPISFTVVSDGTNVVDLNIICETSAGNWSIAAGVFSLLKLVRIA